MGRQHAVKRCKTCFCITCDMPIRTECHCMLHNGPVKKVDVELCDNYKLVEAKINE